AQANIQAHTDININGNVEVTASANNLGSDVTGAFACANLQMDAVTGQVSVNHSIDVQAFALDSGDSNARANASANILANTLLAVGGNVDVLAFANQHGTGGSSASANANLTLVSLTDDVNVNGH